MQACKSKPKSRSRSEDREKRQPCVAKTGSGTSCGESDTLKIMEEFQELYTSRLRSSQNCGEKSLQVMNQTLHDWVCDLTQQNKLLVSTVEELEREAVQRIRDLDSATASAIGPCQKELAAKAERICQLETELKSFCQKMEVKQEELNQANCELETFKSRNKKNTVMKNSDEKVCQLEKELKCLREVIAVKDATLVEYESVIENLQQQLGCFESQSNKSVTAFRRKNDHLEAEVQCLEAELRHKEYEVQNLKKQLDEFVQCSDMQSGANCEKIDQGSMTDFIEEYHQPKLECESLKKHDLELKNLRDKVLNDEIRLQELSRKLAQFQKASRDVQSALTAEVAEKHDIIVSLKREVAQLEEQLRQSDMQTHFKDDIIKQLRKEVKVARAKESLVEMLGLKVSPRSATRCEVERLSAELEEREAAVRRLEEALEASSAPRLEAAASELRQRLEASQKSVLALCDRIAYVRTYLHRLRHDEQLSVKCGLEALLHELNEDLEWNRETRRSVSSLDDGMAPESVIIINRVPSRSLSLPDSTLRKPHEWSMRGWSDTAAYARAQSQQQSYPETNVNLDNNEVCKLEELQRNLEDSSSKLSHMWCQIKKLSLEASSNSTYNDLEEFKEDSRSDHETLGQVSSEIDSILCQPKKPWKNDRCDDMINCLETNLSNMMEMLVRNELIRGTSRSLTNEEYGCEDTRPQHQRQPQINLYSLAGKLSDNLNDSLCILHEIKKDTYSEGDHRILDTMKNVQTQLHDVRMNRQRAIQKLDNIQKIQGDSYCNISKKFIEFDEMYNIHQQTSEQMKKELRSLISKLSYSRDINGSQMDLDKEEMRNIKKELECLRGQVQKKECEIHQRDKMIENLKHSMHDKGQPLKNSYSYPCQGSGIPMNESDNYDFTRCLDEKAHQFQSILSKICKAIDRITITVTSREELLCNIEKEILNLSKTLQTGQQELYVIKESLCGNDAQKLGCSVAKIDAALVQIEFNLNRFSRIFDTYVRDKEGLEKSKLESQKIIASLQTELISLHTDMSEALKLTRDRTTPNSSGYASYRSASPENFIADNLQTQLKLCKDKVQQLECDLVRCSLNSDSSLAKCYAANDFENIPLNDTAAILENTQQQLMEIQKEMRNTLEDAIKACKGRNIDRSSSSTDSHDVDFEDVGKLKTSLSVLHRNLESRERVIENQQETIQLLQDGNRRIKCEVKELESKLMSLRCEKEKIELEKQRVMQELQSKVCSLQASLQKEQQSNMFLKEAEALRDANLELSVIAGQLLEGYQHAQASLSRCHEERSLIEKTTHTTVSALEIVVNHQKKQVKEVEKKLEEIKKEKSCLQLRIKEQADEAAWNQEEIKQIKEKLNSKEIEICQHKTEIRNLQDKIGELQKCMVDQNKHVGDRSYDEIQILQEQIHRLTCEKEKLMSELKHEKNRISDYCNEMISLKSELQEKIDEANHWEERTNRLKENVTTMIETVKAFEMENVDQKQIINDLQCDLDRLRQNIENKKQDYNTVLEELNKNCSLISKMRAEHQASVKCLKQENENLLREKEEMLKRHKEEIRKLRQEALKAEEKCKNMTYNESKLQRTASEKEMELTKKFHEKCNEVRMIKNELESKKREYDEQNIQLQKRKEAMDFLSTKVAQLSSHLDEKEKTIKKLECRYKDLAESYIEAEKSLKEEDGRVSKLEKKLSSMKGKVHAMKAMVKDLQSTNCALEEERCELLAILKEYEEKQTSQGEYSVVLGDHSEQMEERQREGLAQVHKLKIYKERFKQALYQNRCLLEMVDRLQTINDNLKESNEPNHGQCQVHDMQATNSGESSSEGSTWTRVRVELPPSEEEGPA